VRVVGTSAERMSLRGLVGGTFDMASAQLVPASTPFSSEGGWKVGSGERGVCTLLGPEGPDATVGWCATSSGLLLSCRLVWWGSAARTLRTTQWTRASLQHDLSRRMLC
jgi:hypothetical protein